MLRRKVRCHDIHGETRFLSPASVFEYFYHMFFRVQLYLGWHNITLSTIKSPATLACISSTIVCARSSLIPNQRLPESNNPISIAGCWKSRSEAILLCSRPDSQLQAGLQEFHILSCLTREQVWFRLSPSRIDWTIACATGKQHQVHQRQRHGTDCSHHTNTVRYRCLDWRNALHALA